MPQHDHDKGSAEALAPPCGSAWLSGDATVVQDSAGALMALYREGGFEIDEDLPEVPDHVALELEFLYLLDLKLNEARRGGHSEVAAAWHHLRGLFLPAYLGAWIGLFAAAVKASAATDFYRELADLTERFVKLEMASP